MRIGIDGHVLGDHSGGNESYYRNILREMKIAPEDEVFLFIKPTAVWEDYMNKFHVVTFKQRKAVLRNFVELTWLCFKYKLDVLHTQYFIPFIRPCPVVVTIHDICFEHYSNIFTRKEQLRQKLLIPYAAKRAAHIFTVSKHAKNDIASTYRLDPHKISVTYDAVNDNFRKLPGTIQSLPADDSRRQETVFSVTPKANSSSRSQNHYSDSQKKNSLPGNAPDSDAVLIDMLMEKDLRSKFGLGNKPFILTVGNLQPRKNLPRLIRAFNSWKKKGGDASLVIVGKKAWMFNDIMNAAAGGSSDIILTDYVSEEDLIRLYNAATCFIYPSFYEGFGIPPLEAMACGTPVAVANATSLPEVVGDAGLYFDPFNEKEIEASIDRLMKDDSLRKELIKKGFRQTTKFDWARSSSIIYRIYHRFSDSN